MAKEYKCKQCKNKFKKGEGSFIYKADEGYCNHCITAHVDDLNHERWGVPKRISLRNDTTHNGLMRHFGKVPNAETEPDFRQATTVKGKEKKPEIPELYNNNKHCAFCSGEFKKGEKTKKAMGEYPVHEKCPPYPSFKEYMSKKHA